MKKNIFGFLIVFIVVIAFMLTSCGSSNPSESKYWFSKQSTDFVAYDEASNNLEECGTYWNFTAAKKVDIVLSIKLNVDNYMSYANLYVNDEQVKSEVNTGIYTYVYNLSLKKGDKIKIHATWLYGLSADDKGFEIIMMSVGHEGKQYMIKEFDKTTTN